MPKLRILKKVGWMSSEPSLFLKKKDVNNIYFQPLRTCSGTVLPSYKVGIIESPQKLFPKKMDRFFGFQTISARIRNHDGGNSMKSAQIFKIRCLANIFFWFFLTFFDFIWLIYDFIWLFFTHFDDISHGYDPINILGLSYILTRSYDGPRSWFWRVVVAYGVIIRWLLYDFLCFSFLLLLFLFFWLSKKKFKKIKK